MAELLTPTVFRIKRKLTTDPLETLTVNFKRRKNEIEQSFAEKEKLFTEILQFSGSASEDKTGEYLTQLFFNQVKNTGSKNPTMKVNVADIDYFPNSKRVKLSNFNENLFPSTSFSKKSEDSEEIEEFSQFDPDLFGNEKIQSNKNQSQKEDVITCNGVPLERINVKENAVYDFYLPKKKEIHPLFDPTSDWYVGLEEDVKMMNPILEPQEFFVSMHSYDLSFFGPDVDAAESLIFDNFRNDFSTAAYGADDGVSEDSNDENNWRNDYPDEDDDFENRYDYYCQDVNENSDDEVIDWTSNEFGRLKTRFDDDDDD